MRVGVSQDCADAIVTDVRYEDPAKKMVASTLDKFEQVDVLVNNSGIAGPTVNLADIDLNDWNDVMASITIDCSLKRFVEPSEVTEAAVFLVSDESSAITGHRLAVSCGKHILH